MSILTTPRPPASATPQRLFQLTGIGPQLADRITRHVNTLHREWKRYGTRDHLFRDLTSQRNMYDDPGDALTEGEVMQIIAVDPYELVHVRGIGFKRADAIAQGDYGIHPDDERRHAAGNQAILANLGALPMWKYRKDRQRLELRNPQHELAGVTIDHDLVWLPAELEAEQRLADLYQDLLTTAEDTPRFTIPEGLDLGPVNDDQLAAITLATSGVRAMALTGGAGTGKTFVTAAIAKVAKAQDRTMRVVAFAGKAAMRSAEAMREAGVTHVECSTIHRALGLRSQDSTPEHLEEDIIILDEASMVPNWLLAKITTALKPDATLVLVGDPNQLPPIGHGTPFNDYLALHLPHVHLVQNYRQAGQVTIHHFAEAIRAQDPNRWTHDGTGDGVITRYAINPNDAETDFNASVTTAAQSLDLLDWQIVTWKNDTRHQLNQHLQELLNPIARPLFTYRLWGIKDDTGRDTDANVCIGDKVMITDNDYEHGVFNGQLGIITEANHDTLTLDLRDGEPPRDIPISDARDLIQLGYAVTVHKAQGSGWDTVILYQPEPVTFSPRRFYYTSVTRAKNRVELYTTLSKRAWWTNALQPDNDPDSTLTRRVLEAR